MYLPLLTLTLTLSLSTGLASAATAPSAPKRCRARPFDHLVTFGDSYTDNGRLAYYYNNQGKPPPAGTLHPESNSTASGGLAWGQFAARSVGANYLDYAVSGATCSNKIVNRYFSPIEGPFPSVSEDEIPSFVADAAANNASLYGGDRTADNTVYALWIGTNDLGGAGAMLVDSQVAGTNISTFVDCVWSVFDSLHAAGGRRFVLLNEAPLQLSPLYAPSSAGGTGDSVFWPDKTAYNQTEYSQKMMQYTTTVNTVFDYGVPFNLLVEKRWPGATFSLFDVHSLMTDMSLNPAAYFDAPANSTGYYRHCSLTNECTNSDKPLSSFMWYDELHPSERTDQIIAQHLMDVVAGNSTYGVTYK